MTEAASSPQDSPPTVADLFAPPGNAWQPVSTRLRDMHRLVIIGVTVVSTAAVVLLAVMVVDYWWLAVGSAVAGIAAGTWGWWWSARSQQAWGYAERAEDLYIKHGIMLRRLVVVPYGRMQYVDVIAGPVHQRFKIATVTLHTGSPATKARIAGLEPAEAARLRDRLTDLGESHAAGL